MSDGKISVSLDPQCRLSSVGSVFSLPTLKLIVLDHEMSRALPMLFPRAHTVPALCQSCLALAVSLCRNKRPIELARPRQTVLRGSAQLTNNKPPIMTVRQMQVVAQYVCWKVIVGLCVCVCVWKSCC